MASAVQNTHAATGTRLLFIDNIRWALIVLVICHHAAITYSHVGSWYYTDAPKPPPVTAGALGAFLSLNQAYFMGFLFLIAGYFVPGAFDAKGAGRFLRDRAVRLGIPTAFFMLVIHPLTVYWLLRSFNDPSIPSLTSEYSRFLLSGRVLSSAGPMWFALALLIFCVVYAGARVITRGTAHVISPPGHRSVIVLLLLMGTCSFLVRIVQPAGTTILNMQPGYFPQYILMFAVGILAYRGNWLLRIPYSFGRLWMRLACTLGMAIWVVVCAASGAMKGDAATLLGGLHWQSAAFCYWEAFFCLGMCLGLTVIFRDHFNRQGPFSRWMSRNSFSAYLFHTPLLVAVTLGLKPLLAPPIVKFAVASLLAVPITFLLSGLLREKVPGLRRLL